MFEGRQAGSEDVSALEHLEVEALPAELAPLVDLILHSLTFIKRFVSKHVLLSRSALLCFEYLVLLISAETV